ncbi:methyltransferase [Actinomadura luteofluorescens]|uniref:acetylserotonin O-methyltransferase n=1 Tax=Actinomadura luteofluorescens TaxID=46163 RepID=UPI0021648984|nr:acetylserotonin O-methyltransferase [Actinomadura glauciflava]MCR3743505.1 Ubiquinone/menaquinone biosynthesis C-methylase UbiE [Actinomadura glauciflava]
MTVETTPPGSIKNLMEICTGFWAFKAIASAQELGLFDLLHETGAQSISDLARRIDVRERPAETLATALAAVGLLDVDGGRYGNSPLAETYLVKGGRYYFGGWIAHLDQRNYPGWANLTEAIRADRPMGWQSGRHEETPFDIVDPELTSRFQDAMHSLSRQSAASAARRLDLSGARTLLDVGGGTGAWAIELAAANPQLTITIYDLPPVCELARARIEAEGLSDRITAIGGDFRVQELPSGYDTVLLSMILHDWTPDECRRLLRACHRALVPGGQAIISELLVDDDKSGPADAALMSLNMLVTTRGRNYTAAEYGAWLREAGFEAPEVRPLDAPSCNGLVLARRQGLAGGPPEGRHAIGTSVP